MGEVFDALQMLNQMYKLNLSGAEVLRAEQSFKSELARRGNFPKELKSNTEALASDWEVVTYLKPREKSISMRQLNTLAERTVSGSVAAGGRTTGKLATGALSRGAAPAKKASKTARKTARKKTSE
jgi:hypothetical protein